MVKSNLGFHRSLEFFVFSWVTKLFPDQPLHTLASDVADRSSVLRAREGRREGSGSIASSCRRRRRLIAETGNRCMKDVGKCSRPCTTWAESGPWIGIWYDASDCDRFSWRGCRDSARESDFGGCEAWQTPTRMLTAENHLSAHCCCHLFECQQPSSYWLSPSDHEVVSAKDWPSYWLYC
jgi:hypothetical protein